MRRIFTVALVSSLSILAMACAAPTDIPDDEADETLGTAQQAAKKGDPLFGSVCRACGCSMVSRVIDGCTVTRCECTTKRDAECVVNAPGGNAAVVQPAPVVHQFDVAGSIGTAVLSP